MTQPIVAHAEHAEIVREHISDGGEVRAFKAKRRGRVRLLLEVNFGRLAHLLSPDDDRQLYRCTEFQSEMELLSAFDRVAATLAR